MADYINSFTITVVCMVVLSFILRTFAAKGTLGKYVGFVIGVVVSITIASSFVNVGADNFENIIDIPDYNNFTKEEAKAMYNEKILEEFKKNFAKRVEMTVTENTSLPCEVQIMLSVDIDYNISGIEGIYVKMYDVCDTEHIKTIISNEFEVDKQNIHIGGVGVD